MTRRALVAEQWPTYVAAFALAAAPLAFVTWGIAKYIDSDFWTVLFWLVAVRLLFGVIEFAGSFLSWKFVGKQFMVRQLHWMMAEGQMPPRYFKDDGFLTYLSRVTDDPKAGKLSKTTARDLDRLYIWWESQGIWPSMRFDSAAEAALEQYSPRSKAPEWEPDDECIAD
jgi:hypothetical protein